MRKFIRIDVRRRGRRPSGRVPAIVSTVVTTAAVVAFLVLMLPLLGVILAVVLGFMLLACLAAGGWWLLRGRKLWRRLKEDLTRGEGPPGAADRPRKKIDVKVREDE